MDTQGRQSPPAEEQSNEQVGQASSGKTSDAQEKPAGTDNLTSNPKGPLDDAVTEKFAKSKSS